MVLHTLSVLSYQVGINVLGFGLIYQQLLGAGHACIALAVLLFCVIVNQHHNCPGYQWESGNVTIRHHKREPRG